MDHDERPIRVLLIEDSRTDTLLVEETLGQAAPGRFVLSQVSRLADGLSAIASRKFDVILLDLGLPESRRLETIRVSESRANHMPVVALSGMDDAAMAVAGVIEGAQDFLVKGRVAPDLMVRAICCAVHRKGLEEELARRNSQLAEMSMTDGLTGLSNSRHFREALRAASSMAARSQCPLSVVMLDLDFFRGHNDAFGHAAGDDVLCQVGAILGRMTRAHDLAARYGGEQFAVLLPATAIEAARSFAERVRAAIATTPSPSRPVTASVGLATSSTGVLDGETLLAQADDALYRAKRAGRNRVVHHDDPPGPGGAATRSHLFDEPNSDPGSASRGGATGLHPTARLLEQTDEVERICDTMVEVLARAIDLRNRDTGGHSRRVAAQAVRLARRMGVPEDQLVHVRRGAMLHDIGKFAVPDSILDKPGRLNDAEWRVMQRHPAVAREMLQPISVLGPALEIPYCHHERWDGSGYPRGLKGEQIPATARLFAVVDVWDAMTHDRPYRAAWPVDRVRAHIRSAAGKQLDPHAVEVFLAMASD